MTFILSPSLSFDSIKGYEQIFRYSKGILSCHPSLPSLHSVALLVFGANKERRRERKSGAGQIIREDTNGEAGSNKNDDGREREEEKPERMKGMEN